MNLPLVSCIMPTRNRAEFIPAAIDCFRKQTYPRRELIILDDSTLTSTPAIGSDEQIKVVFTETKSIGAKRNECCEMARGSIICHFDDDDWSSDNRIADQVARLINSGKPITGYSTLLFWDTISQQAKLYESSVNGYVCGTTLCYQKDYWKEHPFRDDRGHEDNAFVYPALKEIAASPDSTHMVARIHLNQSSKSGITRLVPVERIPFGFFENESMRLASAN